MIKKTNNPKTSKGSTRKIEVACTAWIDLLGYGSMLAKANFDPTHSLAVKAIERIHKFHNVVASKACRYMPTFVMNDGVIAYRDMSPRSKSVTYDFLKRTIDMFTLINEIDQKELGCPGARMVIAAGFRVRSNLNSEEYLNSGKGRKIKEKLAAGKISAEQAINEALKTRQVYDTTPELQANFAMTKAYLAESSGSKAGFKGPNCFIDLALFSNPLPNWIKFKKTIDWSSIGLSATFGELDHLNSEEIGRYKHEGILDAFEIAKNISNSPDVATKLKKTRVVNSLYNKKT